MSLISLGVAGMRPAVAAAARGPRVSELAEQGITGTSVFGGYLRDTGEYNPELSGLAAFPIYEKMRRSDGQVAATLAAMKLPILGADWTVRPPEDATPVEEEAAEFIRECLLEEIDFEAALSNALLSLDFGCAAHEDAYYVDGNRVRLRRLAPRHPATFYRWITDETGRELAAIEQYGELPGGGYGTAALLMEQAALFTHGQEGGNWAGRSVLRPMYQHWYIKSNLYKIDAIAQERNGMGIPFVALPQGASREDRIVAQRFVEQICAHERAGLALPHGSTFDLKGVTGTVRDAMASIAHHNRQISIAGLAMFLDLGQESGSRALGESQTDFFQLSLQATANRIARVFRLTTVARLVRWNFGEGVRPPVVAAAQIASVGLAGVVEALSKLAAPGFVTPDEGVESWLRAEMGLPAPAAPRSATAAPAKQGGGGAQEGQDGPAGGGEGSDTREAEAAALSAAVRRAAGTVGSPGARRAERCLALSEISSELDRGRDAIAAALRRARPAVQAEAVQRLMSVPVRRMAQVSVPAPERLVAEVEEILRGVFEFGRRQVEEERARQAAGVEPEGAAEVRLAGVRGPAALRKKKRDPLGVYADAVVAELTNGLVSRAANVVMDWMRRPAGLSRGEVIGRVQEELEEQSDRWIDGTAGKGANEAFADGRQDGYEEHADEIGSVIYSALLDINTCPKCAAADGQEGATPEDIPGVPNPDCDGGDRCRCVHVYVFGDEVRR